MKKGHWVLIALIVAFATTWLFFQNRTGFTVRKNSDNLVMQKYLEKDGVHVSFANLLRTDAPFQNVFRYVVIIDRAVFYSARYKADYPENGIWCVGRHPEETRCYIFTNHPPQELRELHRYLE